MRPTLWTFQRPAAMTSHPDAVHRIHSLTASHILIAEMNLRYGQRTGHDRTLSHHSQQQKREGGEMFRPDHAYLKPEAQLSESTGYVDPP